MRILVILMLAGSLIVAGGCGESAVDGTATTDGRGQRFPDVTVVKVARAGETYDFAVTISSPYDAPERYADGWRILAPGGAVLAEKTLGHDHANEQPFTRTQSGVAIPDGVLAVTVEGRDTVNGYGGATRTVTLPSP